MAETERSRTLLDSAMATGALTTIATGGALIGLGLRDGEASRVFRLVGRSLLERLGVASADAPLTSVALGYLHHLASATIWGALFGVIVLRPRSGAMRVVLAVVCAAAYGVLALQVVPPLFRIGYSVTSNAAAVVPIGAALAMALLGDIWIDAAESRG
jgi:hypothetical protein